MPSIQSPRAGARVAWSSEVAKKNNPRCSTPRMNSVAGPPGAQSSSSAMASNMAAAIDIDYDRVDVRNS